MLHIQSPSSLHPFAQPDFMPNKRLLARVLDAMLKWGFLFCEFSSLLNPVFRNGAVRRCTIRMSVERQGGIREGFVSGSIGGVGERGWITFIRKPVFIHGGLYLRCGLLWFPADSCIWVQARTNTNSPDRGTMFPRI